eukprot:scaffold4358_cov177-Ochromonas_danica.AAC.21
MRPTNRRSLCSSFILLPLVESNIEKFVNSQQQSNSRSILVSRSFPGDWNGLQVRLQKVGNRLVNLRVKLCDEFRTHLFKYDVTVPIEFVLLASLIRVINLDLSGTSDYLCHRIFD